MKKWIGLTGIGATVAAAATAGGLGVALAHDGHGRMDGHAMMSGQMMQMDRAGMQEHMSQVLGDDAYQKMQDAMKQALGEDGYQQMFDRMETGCDPATMGAMGQGSPSMPGHATSPGTN